jgi:hypothetical protein
MGVAPQFYTLVGVALGALASYLGASLTNRAQHQREVARRWEERKFETYATYIGDVKQQVIAANRIAASRGLITRVTSPLDPEQGLGLLEDASNRRSQSSERVTLLADGDTLDALRALNEAVWRMECYARGIIKDANTIMWEADWWVYRGAFDAFHRRARAELGTPGNFTDRPAETAPSKAMGGALEAPRTGQS